MFVAWFLMITSLTVAIEAGESEKREVKKERGKEEGECVSTRQFLMLIIRICVYVRYETMHI